MDPASSLIAGHLASKLLDVVTSGFRAHVIERWSRRRAVEFFDQFCKEVLLQREGANSHELQEHLARLIEDEVCSEVLFDAYRRVSLSKSKSLGPRITGLLTAELVGTGRIANDADEAIFSAAENLADNELVAFAKFTREEREKSAAGPEKAKQGELRVELGAAQRDSNWLRDDMLSLAAPDLSRCLGRWAAKLQNCGILTTDVTERQFEYEEDAERHVDEAGTVREITWWIVIPESSFRLVDFISRVRASTQTGA
jgi:hypothetical protein